jgi:dTDP-4-amino-4,6-dideoxygalactose transaminase
MKKRFSSPPHRSEIRPPDIHAALRVMRSGSLSQGRATETFELALASYLGARQAVAVSNGTAGLYLSLHALGVGPGDEVLTTPFSYIASVNALLQLGARPAFVDVEPDTFNLDPSKLAAAVTERSRAILLVHAFGLPCGVDRIAPLAGQFGLPIVEDACEAVGATVGKRKIGTLGQAGVFSFSQNKQISMGEGGAVVTSNEPLADLIRSLRHQGRPMPGEADGFARPGFNYKMTDLQAAIGLGQLRRLDLTLSKRRRIVNWYRELLTDVPEIHLPCKPPHHVDPSWFAFVVRLSSSFAPQDRDRLLSSLREKGIDCANYFPALHLQPFVRRQFHFKPGMYPVCESVAARTIALPISSSFRRREIERIALSLRESIRELRPLTSFSSPSGPSRR